MYMLRHICSCQTLPCSVTRACTLPCLSPSSFQESAAGMSSPPSMIHQCVRWKLGSPGCAHTTRTPRLKAPPATVASAHAIHAVRRRNVKRDASNTIPTQRASRTTTAPSAKNQRTARARRSFSQVLKVARNPMVPISQPPLPHPPPPRAPYRTRGGKAGGLPYALISPIHELAGARDQHWFGPARSTGLAV